MRSAGRFLQWEGPASPIGWWERVLRLPPAIAASSVALAPAPLAPVVPARLDLHGAIVVAALWLCMLVMPDGALAGRLLWPAMALALGAAQLSAGRPLLIPSVVVLPLLAALSLYPLSGAFLLLLAGVAVFRFHLGLDAALPWVVTAWALIAASALLRQLAAERQRTAGLLRDCVTVVAAESDEDSLRLARTLTGADDLALLRGDASPLGITAVESPFIWLQGNQLREERALVAQGLVQLPFGFPRERAASVDLPLAPGSKLFVTAARPEGDDRVGDVARLIGLRESRRWLATRLRDADYNALESLVRALDARDPYTRGHSERVAHFAVALGRELGLPAELLDALQRGGMLHDIGKIGIPEHILHKPERLTAEEYAVMQRHVRIGVEIIDAINSSVNVLDVVSGHHEHHNGTGYPRGLRGDQIPLLARIAHVADSFEAMTSARSYNRPRSFADGLAELRRCAGTQFHPDVVEAFSAVARQDLSAAAAPAPAR